MEGLKRCVTCVHCDSGTDEKECLCRDSDFYSCLVRLKRCVWYEEDESMKGRERAPIYISGPMTGIPGWNYKAFRDAEIRLAEKGFAPINPGCLTANFIYLAYDEALGFDLALLDNCDGIYMLKGWEKSRGARTEHEYAIAKGIERFYEESEENEG